jgi:formylglycine-generating enzyme
VNLVDADQWDAVYNYAQDNGYVFANAGQAQAGNCPIQTVDWYDCAAWCNARSQQAGLAPCYYKNATLTEVYSNATGSKIYLNITNSGFRLPTEAEWERAARGGLAGNRFPWGDFLSGDRANYETDPISNISYDLGPYEFNNAFYDGEDGTSPVGTFPPNGYGLYDLAGNVEEWCWDWYAARPYPAGSPYLGGVNPTGAATGKNRVLRGGTWDYFPYLTRCANRDYLSPGMTYGDIGFRCVRGF